MAFGDWVQVEGDGLDFTQIIFEKKFHPELLGGIARVTFDMPEKYNAMTLSTVDEMFRAFYDANHDTSIGAIVVAGNGKHFGVGGDVEWEKWGLREAFYNRYPHNRLIRILRLHHRGGQREVRAGRSQGVEPRRRVLRPLPHEGGRCQTGARDVDAVSTLPGAAGPRDGPRQRGGSPG
jgi:hypothetical protein